ncbi:RING-H2 finger protein ATL74-like [Hordeum vulgare subsp. vulgare]|uniref:RING-H2 finger protein ATL74-like n=1 Tax=Hordeum vulgare subsp. vulgare TaxID=112509 RepID=UPI001B84AE8E|nr:RING-H2 finger protein ATL74-like [Hordeum vulgare subsp. vulgare]
MGRPDSEAPASSLAYGGSGGAAAPAGTRSASDSALETNVVIILAALFFGLLLVIALNSLARCALRYVGRVAAVADAPGEGRASARVACSGSGIKRRVLRSLPVEVYGSGEDIDDVCAICLSEFVDGEKVRVLPLCGHGFHVHCVDAWLVSHGSCPTCRQPVIVDAPAKAAETDTVITVVIV